MPGIELYQWGEGFNQASFDPFCLSIQAYLNCSGIKWMSNETCNPSISPLGVLPVIWLERKQGIASGADSIIKLLKDRGHDLDQDLSAEQAALSLGLITLIQGKLYDALLYNWWIEGDNFINNTNPTIQKNMSFLTARLLPTKLRERVLVRLKGYGSVALHPESKDRIPRVYANARSIFRLLASVLGDKEFFFGGSSPTTLDCIAWAHLSLHAYPSLKVPTLFSMLTFEFPTLIAYCERLKSRFTLPIVKSPYQKPAFHSLVRDFFTHPKSYLSWALNGFTAKLDQEADEDDAKENNVKSQRIKRFYNGLSIVGALTFFAIFVNQHNIVFIKNSSSTSIEEDEEDEDDVIEEDE